MVPEQRPLCTLAKVRGGELVGYISASAIAAAIIAATAISMVTTAPMVAIASMLGDLSALR
jgi:hypothetical protein